MIIAEEHQAPPCEPKAVSRPAPAGAGKGVRRLDRLLGALVVAFAFLTACFPVANSDFFQHLACGRLLAQGRFPFGADPFAYTTAGVYWANSAWLFDRALYGLYTLPGGGEAVVLGKALLVGALAWVMLLACRRAGQGVWVPAACTALAVLALSPRLLLQPVCVSYLFLAVTLWLLLRGGRAWWLLVPLFALWANLDEWFLLGPATVALYLLGEVIQRRWERPAGDSAPANPRALVVVLALGLGACLVSPYHVHAFRLPWQLGLTPAADALTQDPELRYLFASPLQRVYFQRGVGLNPAGLAYFPLVLVTAASFALNRERPCWRRVLVALAFFLLSLVNSRTVAFFAVVAAPISSLNYLDFAAQAGAAPAPRPWLRWPLAGRVLTALLLLALLAATAPGWLQARPERRRVGWGVQVDPSLRQVALQVRAWREQGVLAPGERLFNSTPEAACYLAWFCPGEASFFDLRPSLFGGVANDYVAVRSALGAGPDPGGPEPAWRGVFRRWNVRFLVLHLRDLRYGTSRAALGRLLVNPDGSPGEWTVCSEDGRTVVAGWADPERGAGEEFAGLRLNADRRAFGPGAVPAPPSPPVPPGPKPWWASLVRPKPARPLAADEAQLHFFRYQALRPRWAQRNQHAWQAALATASLGAGAGGGPLAGGGLLPARLAFPSRPPRGMPAQPVDLLAESLLRGYVSTQDAGPPSALYLAVRSARRALAEGAQDADTYFLLGQAYAQLAWGTAELAGEHPLPHLALVRQTQAITALREALVRDPDHEEAHGLLASLYARGVYLPPARTGRRSSALLPRRNLELELKHRREQLRCARKARRSGESPREFANRLKRLEDEVRSLEGTVRKLLDQYELSAFKRPPGVRAELALERGLGDTALNALLEVRDVEEWFRGGGASGAVRAVELLLSVGRLEDASELLRPENRRAFGLLPPPLDLPAYEWFQVQLAAARGDYAGADEHLAKALAHRGDGSSTASTLLAAAVGHHLLWEAPAAAGMPWQVQRRLPTLFGLPPGRLGLLGSATLQALALWQRETDLTAVRGWLALEAGANSAAREHFRRVRMLCRLPGPRAEHGRVLLLRALPFALRYGALLEANGPWPPPREAASF